MHLVKDDEPRSMLNLQAFLEFRRAPHYGTQKMQRREDARK
jgi:hypothetical protein